MTTQDLSGIYLSVEVATPTVPIGHVEVVNRKTHRRSTQRS